MLSNHREKLEDHIHSYYRSMDKHNSFLRRAKNGSDAEYLYKSNLRPLDLNRYKILKMIFSEADSYLRHYKNLFRVPWKIYEFEDGLGELPFPHTHADTIFLPRQWLKNKADSGDIHSIASTLIHEKIHIYQRLYPVYAHFLILNVWRFSIASTLDIEANKNILRKNPDANKLVYKDSEGVLILPIIQNNNSSKISDPRDHPFEIMAYRLTDIILNKIKPYEEEQTWINTYL